MTSSAADFHPTPEQVSARNADIVDKPQRIAAMTPEEFTPDVRTITDNLQKAVGLTPNGRVPEFIATILRHPKLHHVHTELALALMNGTLSARDRELAVLRVAWLCQAPFEWNAHVNVGKRVARLTSADIERVTQGARAPEWNEDDRAILKAVDELFDDKMVSEDTWTTLAKRLNHQQLLELPILVGQYAGVAYLQNSIRATLMPGDIGLAAR